MTRSGTWGSVNAGHTRQWPGVHARGKGGAAAGSGQLQGGADRRTSSCRCLSASGEHAAQGMRWLVRFGVGDRRACAAKPPHSDPITFLAYVWVWMLARPALEYPAYCAYPKLNINRLPRLGLLGAASHFIFNWRWLATQTACH